MLDAPSARAASMTQVALPDEDVRVDALRADPLHDRLRVGLARCASLIDPLTKAATRQPQPARVDHVDDDERDVSIEGHPDRDPFRIEGDGAEVGRKDDRSMGPGRIVGGRWWNRSDGDRHATIVDSAVARGTCQMAQASGPLVTNGRRGVRLTDARSPARP
jgi:hypothetical protein